jgi:putative restriction endonuclease
VLDEMAVRAAAMSYIGALSSRNGGVVSRAELEGFTFEEESIKLIDLNRGIRNPVQLAATLTIVSKPDGPYDDVETADGRLRYAYRAGDANRGDNRKLRRAAELQVPLILLRWISDGVYVPVFPAYVTRDVPKARFVEIALAESLRYLPVGESELERAYADRVTRQRLHQAEFRARVLLAYKTTCAMCHLRHAELLDAAHITADSTAEGLPRVSNGLSLCKIHHAAFDQHFIGVRPDLIIEVQPRLLREIDGPMLQHGIQGLEGQRLLVPTSRTSRPDVARLETRYDEFRAAS